MVREVKGVGGVEDGMEKGGVREVLNEGFSKESYGIGLIWNRNINVMCTQFLWCGCPTGKMSFERLTCSDI